MEQSLAGSLGQVCCETGKALREALAEVEPSTTGA